MGTPYGARKTFKQTQEPRYKCGTWGARTRNCESKMTA